MSTALYVVAKRKPRAFDANMDGKALANAEESLAVICARLGIKRPMDFVSMDPSEIADMVGEDVPNAPPEQWFEATEGLAVVRTLLSHIQTLGDEVDSAERVKADLEQCERILSHLEQRNIPWHFAIDI
jgi:hypothetical protein